MGGNAAQCRRIIKYLYRCLKSSLYSLLSTNYRKARKSGFYDLSYMKECSSFPAITASDPLWHYIKKSGDQFIKEGELKEKGWLQLPSPHPLFDTAYYLCRYFPHGLKENPYIHYLKKGKKEGLLPGPFFHKIFHTKAEKKESIESWFDSDYYINLYDAPQQIAPAPVRHYKLHGSQEGKSPCLLFSPFHYLEQLDQQQRQRAEADPLSHYICSLFLKKSSNTAQASPFFDPLFYCKKYGVAPTEENIRRYLLGRAEKQHYSSKKSCALSSTPLFSIVVPVYKPNLRQLDCCIRSVLYQTYPHWQLCLVDDGSASAEVQQRLQFWEQEDPRINIKFHQNNRGISQATNTGAKMATGDFLGFLDNDDELSFDCLEQIAAALEKSPADFLYTDEALISTDGATLSLFRKPAYNSSLLLSHNYITHFMVVRKELFELVGGCDSACDGAQDYDLALKISEKASKIRHIAKPLYRWRASENSTSINHDTKNYANENGKKALAAALIRRDISGSAQNSELNFYYRIAPSQQKAAHIFLWQEQGRAESGQNLKFFSTGNYPVKNIISTREQKTAALTAAVLKSKAALSSVPYLLFLDAPFLALAKDWPALLQTAFLDKKVGMVTGRRKFAGEDGTSYRLPDLAEKSTAFFAEFLASHSLHANGMHCLQNLLCPGFGMLAIRSELFYRHNGFDKKYPALAPADFALKIMEEGYSCLYTPEAWIDFPQELNAVTDDCGKEKKLFQQQWHQQLQQDKKFYNLALLEDAGIDQEAFALWFCARDTNS